jgi:hypothetical protein
MVQPEPRIPDHAQKGPPSCGDRRFKPPRLLFEGWNQNSSFCHTHGRACHKNEPPWRFGSSWITISSTCSIFVNVCNDISDIWAELVAAVTPAVVESFLCSRRLNSSRETSTQARLATISAPFPSGSTMCSHVRQSGCSPTRYFLDKSVRNVSAISETQDGDSRLYVSP